MRYTASTAAPRPDPVPKTITAKIIKDPKTVAPKDTSVTTAAAPEQLGSRTPQKTDGGDPQKGYTISPLPKCCSDTSTPAEYSLSELISDMGYSQDVSEIQPDQGAACPQPINFTRNVHVFFDLTMTQQSDDRMDCYHTRHAPSGQMDCNVEDQKSVSCVTRWPGSTPPAANNNAAHMQPPPTTTSTTSRLSTHQAGHVIWLALKRGDKRHRPLFNVVHMSPNQRCTPDALLLVLASSHFLALLVLP